MTNLIAALILGIVQGLTEFLPVSSSAHLVMLPQVMGLQSPLLNSLAFGVVLHAGTLVAVTVYYWRDVVRLLGAWLRSWRGGEAFRDPDARLAWYLILATLPAVLAALAWEDAFSTVFRQPAWVAVWLVVFGLVMGMAERWSGQRRDLSDLRVGEALLIGAAQALALMPGVSRSGIILTAALALNFRRGEAARLAFLLSLPAIGGSFVYELKSLLAAGADQEWLVLAVGLLAAALTGYAAIKFLLAYLQRRTLYIFVLYRLGVGLLVLAWAFLTRPVG
ncbi:MAG: undecaprenyl-diphosphate phosphatase [candidate division FCPU426 bacterium]